MKVLRLLALCAGAFSSLVAIGQTRLDSVPVNLRFSATRAQTLTGTCCFYLTGGAADAAVALPARTSAVVEISGGTTARVSGTSRGLSTVALLAGPRYTLPVRRTSLSAQALFGAARGFDADFTSGSRSADTATAFAMTLGGFAEMRLSRSLSLRAVQVDFLQSNLPNGGDNRQRNVRVGAGLTFRVPLPSSRR